MRITRIENQKKRPGRKNIYVDGEFLAGVSNETLLRLALRSGDEIGPDQLAALQKTEEFYSAKNAALRYLGIRPRTIVEVRDKLREKEFSDPEIEHVTAELKEAGLLDDAAFACMFIRNSIALRPIGPLLLKRKLLLLGVDKETTENSLRDTLEPGIENETATKIARRFLKTALGKRGEVDKQKLRHKLASFLGRRGYTWDIIEPVMKKLLQASEDE